MLPTVTNCCGRELPLGRMSLSSVVPAKVPSVLYSSPAGPGANPEKISDSPRTAALGSSREPEYELPAPGLRSARSDTAPGVPLVWNHSMPCAPSLARKKVSPLNATNENGSDDAVTALTSFTSDAGATARSRRGSSGSVRWTRNGERWRESRVGRDMGAPKQSVFARTRVPPWNEDRGAGFRKL